MDNNRPVAADRSAAQDSVTELNSGILPGNVHADDYVMLTLAVISVGLLGYVVLSPPSYAVGIWLFYCDVAICAVFLGEFLWRWHKHGWHKMFPVKNWYEVFALIPIAHPALYHLHFVTVVLLLVRIGRGIDRVVGEQFTYRLVDKLSVPIVHAIKKPVTIAVLDEVVKVLETGNYPENLARSLTENRAELRTIISEKLSEDRQLSKLKLLPFHAEIVHSVVDTSFRVVLEVLQDPRIDDFFSSVVRDNREQIRKAVQLGLNEHDSVEAEKLLPVRTQRSALREFDSSREAR
jgi:voltage-gated potassium channel